MDHIGRISDGDFIALVTNPLSPSLEDPLSQIKTAMVVYEVKVTGSHIELMEPQEVKLAVLR